MCHGGCIIIHEPVNFRDQQHRTTMITGDRLCWQSLLPWFPQRWLCNPFSHEETHRTFFCSLPWNLRIYGLIMQPRWYPSWRHTELHDKLSSFYLTNNTWMWLTASSRDFLNVKMFAPNTAMFHRGMMEGAEGVKLTLTHLLWSLHG